MGEGGLESWFEGGGRLESKSRVEMVGWAAGVGLWEGMVGEHCHQARLVRGQAFVAGLEREGDIESISASSDGSK